MKIVRLLLASTICGATVSCGGITCEEERSCGPVVDASASDSRTEADRPETGSEDDTGEPSVDAERAGSRDDGSRDVSSENEAQSPPDADQPTDGRSPDVDPSGDAGRAEAGGNNQDSGTSDATDSGRADALDGSGRGDEGDATGGVPPFACGDPLPVSGFPTVLTAAGSPEAPSGGAITDGVYVLVRVTIYGAYSSVPWDGLELRNGYVHWQHTTYTPNGEAMTGWEEIGQYATVGAALAVDNRICGRDLATRRMWTYSATATRIQLYLRAEATTWVETFALQPE